jgi:hypothetical protein
MYPGSKGCRELITQRVALPSRDRSDHGAGVYTKRLVSISVSPHVPRGTRYQAPMISWPVTIPSLQEWTDQKAREALM